MLASPKMTSKDWWLKVKPEVRKIEQADGLIIIDDSIEEKPYTDENEIICWHWDHLIIHLYDTVFLNVSI